jgi:hypothetical protein
LNHFTVPRAIVDLLIGDPNSMLVSGLAANAGTELCTLDFVAASWSPGVTTS